MRNQTTPHRTRDRGTILPMVLVMSTILSVVIVAVAGYVATGLNYSEVVEERADRLAAADGGLRYGLERLGDSQYAKCLSKLGSGGTEVQMPTLINGAEVKVTCYEKDGGLSRIKAWAIIVTGDYNDPADDWLLKTSGTSSVVKLLGGPVWVEEFDKMQLDKPLTIKDGDIWFHEPDCDNYTLAWPGPAALVFEPAYRGPICVDRPWTDVFEEPYQPSKATISSWVSDPPPDTTTYPGCTVFEPGTYTTMPALGPNTYFKSGDYVFLNVDFNISHSVVTAGWADFDNWGDQQFIQNLPCQTAIDDDEAASKAAFPPIGRSGATFFLGGSSKIYVGTQGTLEILRRLQPDGNLVSIRVLRKVTGPATPDPHASTVKAPTNILMTQSGNVADLAVHGLAWAPQAGMNFGNVTNSANGQLLGGGAFARIELQSSASANAFAIRVETSPIAFYLQIIAEAKKNGKTTTMSAIVQVDDRLSSAVNSVRVVEN